MTDSRHTPDPDDLLVTHFRQHGSGEPPASLDAFILNAARREAPAPQPSLWQRWLLACRRPRWQMAFASVAGVALMVGMLTRSPVPQPELATATFSAPMARLAVAPHVNGAPANAEIAASLADQPAAALSKRAPVASPSLEEGLQQIVSLRRAGQTKAADEKLLALHQRFPNEDLPARLEALKR